MPLDPSTGLWTNSVSQSPGPGGAGSPIGGFLGIMNAFTASDLARQAQAQRLQQQMEAIQKQAQSGGADLYATPEGESINSAYGISPDTSSQIFESSPNRRIRTGMAALKDKYGDDQIPSNEIESLYLGEGLPAPAGLYGYMGRQTAATVAQNKITSAADTAQKRMDNRTLNTVAGKAAEIIRTGPSQGLTEQEAFQRAQEYAAPFLSVLPEDQAQIVKGAMQNATATAPTTQAPLPAARIGELEQRTKTEAARADYLGRIAKVREQAEKEKETMDPLRKQLLNLQISTLSAKAGGQMTPQVRASLMTRAASLEKEIANRSNLTGLEISPEAKPANDALIADNKARLAEINQMLAADTKAKATAAAGSAEPSAGWQNGDTVHYPDGSSQTLVNGVWTKTK